MSQKDSNINNQIQTSSQLISKTEDQGKTYYNPKKKKNIDFDISKFLLKKYCTSLYFGTEKIKQQCYICEICNPSRDKKVCEFCYKNCHSQCRSIKSYNSELSKEIDKKKIKKEIFFCSCGIINKHKPKLGDKSELISCNLIQLDKILGVNSIFCKTHQSQICCICSVTCHKECNVYYDNEILNGNCICRSEFHTNFNELALSFPFEDYKEKTGISCWKIQTLNILFKTKIMFSKMEKLFFKILNFGFQDNSDDSFFGLLDLLNRNLNSKFKIYYFDNEFVKMFNYKNCMNYINILPNYDMKIVLSKMRLLYIIMLIHFKSDYQYYKVLTTKDLLSSSIIDRFKYKLLLESNNELNQDFKEKYEDKNIYFNSICNLLYEGIPILKTEQCYVEIENTIKYILTFLKHMKFNNEEIKKIIISIYPVFDNFYNSISNEKNNLYNYLGIYKAFAELFLEISVNYNDNIIRDYLDKDKKINNFIHKKNEEGDLLFRMIIKSTEILKKHYDLLLKNDIDENSIEEKNRIEKLNEHKNKFVINSQNQKADLYFKLPENGSLLSEKTITCLNYSLNIFCLGDNFYYKQIEKITKEDIEDYKEMKNKINKNIYGNFYNDGKFKNDKNNSLINVKKTLETYLFNLFDNPLRDDNLKIGNQILETLKKFIVETVEKFRYYLPNEKEKKKRRKNKNKDKENKKSMLDLNLDQIKYDISGYLPFISIENFDEQKNNFIESLCLYSIDESLSKILIFFTMRKFPPLMTIELFDTILSIFQLYFFNIKGMKFFLLGKNLNRILKTFRHYQCMKDSKNSNEKYNIDTDSNLPFAERCLKIILKIGKLNKYYTISLKGNKGIIKIKKYLIEHLQYLFLEKSENPKFSLLQKYHLYLCVKIYLLYADYFSYEDFEDIKIKLMYLFLNSPFDLTEKDKFIKQYNEINEMKPVSNNSSFHIHLPMKKYRKEKIERQQKKNKNEIIIYEISDFDSQNKLSKTELMIDENTIFMKIYLKFFSVFSKNTYFVFKNTQQEDFINEIFNINSISGFKTLFERNVINLEEKTILLNFIRTFTFLDHLDRTDLFSNKKPLTNIELKEIVNNQIIKFDNLDSIILSDSKKKIDKNKLKNKYNDLILLEEVLDLFIFELKNFPKQIQTETEIIENIFNYIQELILDIKFIGDYFFSSKDIANKILPKFYLLTDIFMTKVDIIKEILLDIEKENSLKADYSIKSNIDELNNDDNENKTTNQNLYEIHRTSFNIYDKDKVYSFLSTELTKIFTITKLIKNNNLSNYLEKFDTISEINFTPFSLIEKYDYEYFYDEINNKKEKKDKVDTLIKNIITKYNENFMDIPSTNFYQVFTEISNDSMKIDYRKKITDYYQSFINSKEAYFSEKLENLTCLINKLLFYNSKDMQYRFYNIKNDKFFFPNINMELHQFINLTIISSRNIFVFKRAEINISITKLLIQFLQLLGVNYNLEYHENIFKLQKDVNIIESYENILINEDYNNNNEYEKNFDEEETDIIFNSPMLKNQNRKNSNLNIESEKIEDKKSEKSKKKKKDKKGKDKNKEISFPNNFSSEENTIIFINEPIYFSLVMNLKRCFGLIDIKREINIELPNDKLIVLLTNIFDFLIQYIETKRNLENYIFEGINELFFGEKFDIKKYDLYRKLEKEDTIIKTFSTKISVLDIKMYSFRRKIICYIKNKYVQLLINYFLSGKHENTFLELNDNGISAVKLYDELLYNFLQCILNIKKKDKKLYKKIIKVQKDEKFINELLNVYIYGNILKEIIEFQLCLNLFILIKILNEKFKYNPLNTLFENIINENYIQEEIISEEMEIDINSYFSKRTYLFFNKLILTVEIKNSNIQSIINKEEEEKIIINNISKKIYKGINLTEEEKKNINDDNNENNNNEDNENNKILNSELYEPTGNNKKLNIQYPQHFINTNSENIINKNNSNSILFFIRPSLTFRLNEQSKKSFEKNVNRSNASNKFISLIKFSDYSIFEMIVNQHLLGTSSIKKAFSNMNYYIIEIINFIFILIENILIMYYYYVSPSNLDYDLVKDNDRNKVHFISFLLSIVHLVFLFIIIFIWFYFKFILEYQSNVMKRYNNNFIIRKKNENSIIPNLIVNYFKGESISSISITKEKNKNISNFKLFYVGLFDTIFLNRNVNFLFFTFIFNVLYILLKNNIFLSIPLIFIINLIPNLFDIYLIIKMKFISFITIIFLTILIVYIYMWISYFYLDFLFNFDVKEKESNEIIKETFCNSSLQCLLFIIQQSFLQGGLSNVLNINSYQTDYIFFIGRFFYDIIFFILIILILFNLFIGLIIDSFIELSNINLNREYDMKNICFICQMNRDECLINNIDFDKHIKEEHNLWNYCFFLCHLHLNNRNDFNTVENYVWNKLSYEDNSWFPLNSF